MEALVKINAVKEEHVISYLGDNLNQVCWIIILFQIWLVGTDCGIKTFNFQLNNYIISFFILA